MFKYICNGRFGSASRTRCQGFQGSWSKHVRKSEHISDFSHVLEEFGLIFTQQVISKWNVNGIGAHQQERTLRQVESSLAKISVLFLYSTPIFFLKNLRPKKKTREIKINHFDEFFFSNGKCQKNPSNKSIWRFFF